MILTREQLKQIFGVDYYSGVQLKERFGYKVFREKILPIGSIIAFRAPMDVSLHLIDLEDALNDDFIHSEDAINFCFEVPNLCPIGAVAFQRLFNTQIANLLSEKYIKAPIKVEGDDLRVQKEHNQGGIIQQSGKASVSIVVSRNNVALGHTAINIQAGKKAPVFAYSTGLTDPQSLQFMTEVTIMFYELLDSLFCATAKVQ